MDSVIKQWNRLKTEMMILRSDILTGKVRFSLGLLGICFWRKGRGNPGLAEYMGE